MSDDQRQEALAAREAVADRRDNLADRRDRIADARDDAADLREQVMNEIAQELIDCTEDLRQSRVLNDQLQHALESRICIEQAKGILAGERAISLSQAFEQLRDHARSHNATLHSVAYAVVNLKLRSCARIELGPGRPALSEFGVSELVRERVVNLGLRPLRYVDSPSTVYPSG